MTLEPDTVTLIPGKSAGFLVSLTGLNGFSEAVTLSAGNLPSGVTARFSPNPVTPPGNSVLTLQATADAALGAFRLELSGASASLTNTSSTTVTVNFGLLPVCQGAVKGRITDVETGLPMGNVQVGIYQGYGWYAIAYAQTDTNGFFVRTNLPLSTDNLPQSYQILASAPGYWNSDYVGFTAVCGAVSEANAQLLKKQYTTLSGTVTDPDQKPLPGVSVSISGHDRANVNTDTNGVFKTPQLQLATKNQPGSYSIDARASGYWNGGAQVTGYGNSNTVVKIVLVPICDHVSVTGRVVYAGTELPAAGASVSLSGSYQSGSATVDQDGNYRIDNQTLNHNNNPASCTVTASKNGYYSTNAPVNLTSCETTFAAPLLRLPPLPPPPQHYYAGVTGYVYDQETGEVLTNSVVSLYWGVRTDSQGMFVLTNFDLGTVSSNLYSLSASHDGYYNTYSNLWLFGGQMSTQDMRLLKRRYAYVSGTVTDSIHHAPVVKASISGNVPYCQTDERGQYLSGPLHLNGTNQATGYSLQVSRDGYWPIWTNFTGTADTTNVVDIELIKVCTGANILGTVVNAVTQEPIAGATVQGGNRYSLTDTNGHFALTNLVVGNNNSPIETTVSASAPGFNSQSKSVTIFCGANILTQFGRPQTVFGAIEGYVTNVLTGLPLTNVFVGTEFGAATSTDTTGYYKLTQVPLGLNAADTSWLVTAMPAGQPKQTKPILVSSNYVSRLDFGFGAPNTDLALSATVSPNPASVGDEVTWTVILNNDGGDAQNVVVTGTMDPAVAYVRASVSDPAFSAPVFTNGTVMTMTSNFLANASATLSIVLKPGAAGTVTNRVSVASDTEDTNPGNNTALSPLAVRAGTLAEGLEAGPLLFNPQTGLFEQTVTVIPSSSSTVTGVQLGVAGIPAGKVYNASGATNGVAFIQYGQSVAPGTSVSFLVEYYLPNRQTNGFAPQFSLTPLTPLPSPPAAGQVLQLDRDAQMLDGRCLIEFASTPGRTYTVQYSPDMQTWENAAPPVVAAGTRVQWYDDGPPKTSSKPARLGSRFYRVVLVP